MIMDEVTAKRLAPFRHLWKTDDKAWMKQRREDWEYIEAHYFDSDTTKKYIRSSEKYFLKGEKEMYINHAELYFYTPIASSGDARALICSDLWLLSERSDLATDYIDTATRIGQGLPWLRQHIRYFVDGVLGNEYRYEEATEPSGTYVVSPDPKWWCKTFIIAAEKLLSGKVAYHGCVEAVDYFVSALPLSDDPFYRSPKRFNRMLSFMDAVLGDENASEIAREFAEKLKAREQEIRDNWALHAHLDEA